MPPSSAIVDVVRRCLRLVPLAAAVGIAGAQASDRASATRLTDLVFDYRAQNGEAAIPLSPTLMRVAEAHVADLERNPPEGRCTAHSWSNDGPWSACCYTRDHAQARCMWDKPRELGRGAYAGQGFEIVCRNDDGMTPDAAMACWRGSRLHHDVLLGRGPWREDDWRALGVAMSAHYAVVWVGREAER
jgi:hypothetical protein